jgi:hypothetical protein
MSTLKITSRTFEILPEATYRLRVESIEEKQSQQGYKPFFSWKTTVMEDVDYGQAQGKTFWLTSPVNISPSGESKYWRLYCAVNPEFEEMNPDDPDFGDGYEIDITKPANQGGFVGLEFYIKLHVRKKKNSTDEKNDFNFSDVWSVERFFEMIDEKEQRRRNSGQRFRNGGQQVTGGLKNLPDVGQDKAPAAQRKATMRIRSDDPDYMPDEAFEE